MTRVAVLGAGRIGQIHAANVAAHPRATLVAVSDAIPAAAESLAAWLGVEATTDTLGLIRRPDIDAVIIGTPSDTHVELMLAAARAGRAILCEKPLDNDLAKADAAVVELERLGARAMLGFNRRFDPSNIALRRAIDAGQIGEVRQVLITSRDPALAPRAYLEHSGGIFRDMIIHDFDMARFLLGDEPVEVWATASRLVEPELMAAIGDHDTVMVVLRTRSGVQCLINGTRQAAYGYDQRFEVHGSRGMLLNDNLRPTTLRRYGADVTEARPPLLDFFVERYADAYRNELDAFLTAVESNGPMPTTPRDGRAALRLAVAAIESVETGRIVSV